MHPQRSEEVFTSGQGGINMAGWNNYIAFSKRSSFHKCNTLEYTIRYSILGVIYFVKRSILIINDL